MYWIHVTHPVNDEAEAIEGVPPAIATNDLAFDEGSVITIPVPPIHIERTNPLGPLPDNVIAWGCRGLLVSPRYRAALRAAGVDNVDYYPCFIRNSRDGTEVNDYAICNIIGRIACVNFDDSNVEMHELNANRIQFIDSLALDEGRALGQLIFRLAECPMVVVAHDRVRESFGQFGITGVEFVAPRDFVL